MLVMQQYKDMVEEEMVLIMKVIVMKNMNLKKEEEEEQEDQEEEEDQVEMADQEEEEEKVEVVEVVDLTMMVVTMVLILILILIYHIVSNSAATVLILNLILMNAHFAVIVPIQKMSASYVKSNPITLKTLLKMYLSINHLMTIPMSLEAAPLSQMSMMLTENGTFLKIDIVKFAMDTDSRTSSAILMPRAALRMSNTWQTR